MFVQESFCLSGIAVIKIRFCWSGYKCSLHVQSLFGVYLLAHRGLFCLFQTSIIWNDFAAHEFIIEISNITTKWKAHFNSNTVLWCWEPGLSCRRKLHPHKNWLSIIIHNLQPTCWFLSDTIYLFFYSEFLIFQWMLWRQQRKRAGSLTKSILSQCVCSRSLYWRGKSRGQRCQTTLLLNKEALLWPLTCWLLICLTFSVWPSLLICSHTSVFLSLTPYPWHIHLENCSFHPLGGNAQQEPYAYLVNLLQINSLFFYKVTKKTQFIKTCNRLNNNIMCL